MRYTPIRRCGAVRRAGDRAAPSALGPLAYEGFRFVRRPQLQTGQPAPVRGAGGAAKPGMRRSRCRESAPKECRAAVSKCSYMQHPTGRKCHNRNRRNASVCLFRRGLRSSPSRLYRYRLPALRPKARVSKECSGRTQTQADRRGSGPGSTGSPQWSTTRRFLNTHPCHC